MKIEDVYEKLSDNHIARMITLQDAGNVLSLRGRPPIIPVRLGVVTKGWSKLTALGVKVLAYHNAP